MCLAIRTGSLSYVACDTLFVATAGLMTPQDLQDEENQEE